MVKWNFAVLSKHFKTGISSTFSVDRIKLISIIKSKHKQPFFPRFMYSARSNLVCPASLVPFSVAIDTDKIPYKIVHLLAYC